jgi:hypothetical protein
MRSIAILIATCAFATVASAQDVFTDNEAALADDGTVIVNQPAPLVYGYTTIRPIDCGTFHYWNGERSADARFDPPVAR